MASLALLVSAAMHRGPLWSDRPINVSEAAATRDRATMIRLIDEGSDPAKAYPVAAGILSDRPLLAHSAGGGDCGAPARGRRPPAVEAADREASVLDTRVVPGATRRATAKWFARSSATASMRENRTVRRRQCHGRRRHAVNGWVTAAGNLAQKQGRRVAGRLRWSAKVTTSGVKDALHAARKAYAAGRDRGVNAGEKPVPATAPPGQGGNAPTQPAPGRARLLPCRVGNRARGRRHRRARPADRARSLAVRGRLRDAVPASVPALAQRRIPSRARSPDRGVARRRRRLVRGPGQSLRGNLGSHRSGRIRAPQRRAWRGQAVRAVRVRSRPARGARAGDRHE